MKDYDENPIIIKDKEFKIGMLFIICFSPLFCIFIDDINNSMSRVGYISLVAISLCAIPLKKFIKRKNSNIYFTNYQIYQKDDKEVFKEFKIADIKLVAKSFRGFPHFIERDKLLYNELYKDNLNALKMRNSLISKSITILGFCYFAWIIFMLVKIDYKSFMHEIMYPVMLALLYLLFLCVAFHPMFRLIDGLNLDILKNNVLIQTENEYIILKNLTKKEFDRLEEYFRNFNIEIKG